jgi:hypothetical protein
MRTRTLVRAAAAALLGLAGGCTLLPVPRGPSRNVLDRSRHVEAPAWTDLLACAVTSDTAHRHGELRSACADSRLDADKPTQPLPRPANATP